MENFKPFLLAGLRNRAEYQVCHAAVGLVGDLARSLQSHISAGCHGVRLIDYPKSGNFAFKNTHVLNVRVFHGSPQNIQHNIFLS